MTDANLIKLVQRYGELCTQAAMEMECCGPVEADKIAVEAAEVFAQIRGRLAALAGVAEAAKAWRAMRASTPTTPKPESAALIAAVDALAAGEVSADPT